MTSQICINAEATSRNLYDTNDRGMKVPVRTNGPSSFLPNSEVIPVNVENLEAWNLFVDAFISNNRLEQMIQVMAYHPQYLEAFLKMQHSLMRGDGPLPFYYRHYIAIMAAGRHQCAYLINLQMAEFLLQDGNDHWLSGLTAIPQKLKNLYELNKLMAHRPWLITKAHIERLATGADNWSLSELMHAVLIMAHFHALSSFIYGCGINAEIDFEDGHCYRQCSVSSGSGGSSPDDQRQQPFFCGRQRTPPSSSAHLVSDQGRPTTSSQCQAASTGQIQPVQTPGLSPSTLHVPGGNNAPLEEGSIEVLLQRLRRITECQEEKEMSQEELIDRYQKVESQSIEFPAAASRRPLPKKDILRFAEDMDLMYQDFAKRSAADILTFRAQDYCWDNEGYSLTNTLYPYNYMGELLDDRFKIAFQMTYNTLGNNTNVDTTSFRRAVWYYIHCIFGIRHDDYDYSEVNHLLERNLKAYIKIVSCYPERVTRKDYDSCMKDFYHSEKVHVNLMVLEARLQAELLYTFRAITKHMT